jgi:hypothetical protein
MPPSYDDLVVRLFGLIASVVIAASACAPVTSTPSPATPPGSTEVASSGSAGAARPEGLAERPLAKTGAPTRRWYTVPDGLFREDLPLSIMFPNVDATPGRPRARLRSTGRTVDLALSAAGARQWTGSLSLDGAAVGEQTVEYLVRLGDGTDAVVDTQSFLLSAPEYVIWTLDFEGDAATDAALGNTNDIARSFSIPMTLMWNPRVWTTVQVSDERANAMLQWTMKIASAGEAEIALHIHAWTDFVRAAGVTPRVSPSWASRGDGYDVPLTAFNEAETKQLIDHALRLMSDHAMPRPTSFRGGGLFANAANLRAVAAAGFTVDTSATPSGDFGQLALPWSLPRDAQPYRPSRDDASVPGDLPLLEVPNIAGNTYGLTAFSIQRVINDDRAMLAPAGSAAMRGLALTLVSHPATIDATERAAIEALFRAFDPYRYDHDAGPLRFVTLAQLAKAYSR